MSANPDAVFRRPKAESHDLIILRGEDRFRLGSLGKPSQLLHQASFLRSLSCLGNKTAEA